MGRTGNEYYKAFEEQVVGITKQAEGEAMKPELIKQLVEAANMVVKQHDYRELGKPHVTDAIAYLRMAVASIEPVLNKQPPTESYAARQAAWVEANGIEVGSRVRVTRKAESKDSGWKANWNSPMGMDDCIDRDGIVRDIDLDYGLSIVFSGGHSWSFPYFVLEPVEPAPQPPLQVREAIQVQFGTGRIAISRFNDANGMAGVLLWDSGGQHPVGSSVGDPPDPNHLPQPGEIYLRFANAESVEVLREELALVARDLIAEVPPPSESPVMETPKVAVEDDDIVPLGSIIEEGFEWEHPISKYWHPVEPHLIGQMYIRPGVRVRRRRITPEPEREATYRAFRSAEEATNETRPCRRLAGIVYAGEYLGDFIRHGARRIEVNSKVPASATFHKAYFDEARNAFVVVMEDESFDEVPLGCLIPILPEAIVSVFQPCGVRESEAK